MKPFTFIVFVLLWFLWKQSVCKCNVASVSLFSGCRVTDCGLHEGHRVTVESTHSEVHEQSETRRLYDITFS